MQSPRRLPYSPDSPEAVKSWPSNILLAPDTPKYVASAQPPQRYLSPPMSRSASPAQTAKRTDADSNGSGPGSPPYPQDLKRPHPVPEQAERKSLHLSTSPRNSHLVTPAPRSGQSQDAVPGPAAARQQSPRNLSPLESPKVARRKGKAHVESACANCKKAHLSCDIGRPCTRCVQSGKQDTCVDVEHKKRGRPRLTEERRSRQTTSRTAPKRSPEASSVTKPLIGIARPGRTDPLRTLRPLEIDPRSGAHQPNPGVSATSTNTSLNPTQDRAIAFLDFTFNLVRVNHIFRQSPFPRGAQNLDNLLNVSERPRLVNLQHMLRQERDTQKRGTLPPIWDSDNLDVSAVPAIETCDIARATQGSRDHLETFMFRFANGQFQTLTVTFTIARTASAFVVLTFPRHDFSEYTVHFNSSHSGLARDSTGPYPTANSYMPSYSPSSMYVPSGYPIQYPMAQPLHSNLVHLRTDLSPSPSEAPSPLYTSSSIVASLPPTTQASYYSPTTYGHMLHESQRYSSSELAPYTSGFAEGQWQERQERQNELQLPPLSTDQQQHQEQGWDMNSFARWEKRSDSDQQQTGLEDRNRRRLDVRELAG